MAPRVSRLDRLPRASRPRKGVRRSNSAAVVALLVAHLVVALVLAGCGFAASEAVSPTATPTALPSVPTSIALTASEVEAALRRVGIGLIRPQTPFRPGESTALMDAPRAVYQAVLNDDPDHGFIVIYDFGDAATAYAAGQEMAVYLASGPGRVQFPIDVHAVLREVGTTLVFFTWSPAGAVDPRTGDVETALDTVGQGIPVSP